MYYIIYLTAVKQNVGGILILKDDSANYCYVSKHCNPKIISVTETITFQRIVKMNFITCDNCEGIQNGTVSTSQSLLRSCFC